MLSVLAVTILAVGVTFAGSRVCGGDTFDGSANLLSNVFDGGGNGTNRWCITDSGDAAAADILAGKVAWVDGTEIIGAMAPGHAYGDESGAYVLGTAAGSGTALLDQWNGSRSGGAYPGGTQAEGGVDDFDDGLEPMADRYVGSAGWTTCDVQNNFCDTGDRGADAKDNSTGLIWSLPCNESGCASFSDASPDTYSWDRSHSNNDGLSASELCTSHAGWWLPHQKQLMQAYIDGSYGNLEEAGIDRYYWSATTYSNTASYAWYTGLSIGFTGSNGKKSGYYVRCIRPTS